MAANPTTPAKAQHSHYDVAWESHPQPMPGRDAHKDFFLATYYEEYDLRAIRLTEWDADRQCFVIRDVETYDDAVIPFTQALAWHRIVSPEEAISNPEGRIRWHKAGGSTLPILVGLGRQVEVAKKGGRVVMTNSFDDPAYGFWAELPFPFDPGDGSAWVSASTIREYGCWRLAAVSEQVKQNGLTCNEFGRELNRACAMQMANESNDIVFECRYPSMREAAADVSKAYRIPKAVIVPTKRCSLYARNIWPYAVPNIEDCDEIVWHVEYRVAGEGKVRSGAFRYNGRYFYNDELVLADGEPILKRNVPPGTQAASGSDDRGPVQILAFQEVVTYANR